MYSSDGLGEAILLGILLFIVAPFALFVFLLIAGFKKNKLLFKVIGGFGLSFMLMAAIIFSVSEITKTRINNKLNAQANAELIKTIPPVYTTGLNYIEKNTPEGKPVLRGVLYKSDAYEVTLDTTPIQTKFRGFKDSLAYKTRFDPTRNMCEFEWFFEKERGTQNNFECVPIAKTEDGAIIYTNQNSANGDAYSYSIYFGVVKPGTLLVLQTSLAASNYSITDPRNTQAKKIIETISTLKQYENTNLANYFEINANTGLSR